MLGGMGIASHFAECRHQWPQLGVSMQLQQRCSNHCGCSTAILHGCTLQAVCFVKGLFTDAEMEAVSPSLPQPP
eukprot:1114922-Prorocentrum_lima.AAC.1